VIGVQECMDLADLQIKIIRHLVSGSTGKYVHYSREIGKRATALGYHGYIALCIFVRATAVAAGRFQMPHRQSSNKNAQEVFRGKSLLLFGRASNKGAVGMSFRFDDTSFAFVTCHLASDSSSLKRAKRKKSSNAVTQTQKAGDSSADASLLNNSGSVARSSGGDSAASKASVSDGAAAEPHQPPSKVERRNQDAMEILQQLYLDEEDYGFGFPHLHHHSFILGDFNYRMTRKGATPMDMLELLVNAGSDHHQACEDVYTMDLSSPCSPAMLQTSISELSLQADEGDFRQCITPKVQSPTPIVAARKSHRQEPCRYVHQQQRQQLCAVPIADPGRGTRRVVPIVSLAAAFPRLSGKRNRLLPNVPPHSRASAARTVRPGHVSAELLARGDSRRLSGTVVHGPRVLQLADGDAGQSPLLFVRLVRGGDVFGPQAGLGVL
jgi:hypothetical protein